MGYVPTHLYIVTGDKRFKADYDKQHKQDVIGIAISGGLSFLAIIGAAVYCFIKLGG